MVAAMLESHLETMKILPGYSWEFMHYNVAELTRHKIFNFLNANIRNLDLVLGSKSENQGRLRR